MRILIIIASAIALFFQLDCAIAANQTNNTKTVSKKNKTTKKATKQNNTSDDSLLNQKVKQENAAQSNPSAITLYEPNYILPGYYTFEPYNSVYNNNTPDEQHIDNTELKFQISFKAALIRHFFFKNTSLNVAYTQDSWWQAYNQSPFFRETNYEPSVFFETHLQNAGYKNWRLGLVDLGVMHQSNGRGGSLERSWNRAYFALSFEHGGFVARIEPWYIIQDSSMHTHNSDIGKYLGYGQLLFIYKLDKLEASLMVRNAFESNFSRGALQTTLSYPLSKRVRIYALFFNGYGQSLIEYDHYTNAVGLGIAFNDYV